MALDERLRRAIEHAGGAGRPERRLRGLIRRRERRRIRRRVGSGLLALAVVAGTAAGVFALSRFFGGPGEDEVTPLVPVSPTGAANGLVAFTTVTGSSYRLPTDRDQHEVRDCAGACSAYRLVPRRHAVGGRGLRRPPTQPLGDAGRRIGGHRDSPTARTCRVRRGRPTAPSIASRSSRTAAPKSTSAPTGPTTGSSTPNPLQGRTRSSPQPSPPTAHASCSTRARLRA